MLVIANRPLFFSSQQHPKERKELNDRVVGVLHQLMVAGYETTASTLPWIVYYLALNPHVHG